MLMSNRKPPESRLHKYGRRALYGLGGLIGFIALLVLGVLFSLRFARVRRVVVNRVNASLADSFKGRIALHHVQHIGLGGVSGAEAEIYDPSGRRVLDIHGADVSLGVLRVAWSALTHGKKPLTISFDRVAVAHVEAVLVDDGTGSPTLADTFTPKTPSPPSTGPGTIISIPRIELGHVWAHGALSGTAIDAELRHGLGSLLSAPDTTKIEFQRVSVIARGLPQGVDPVGELRASLELPAAPNAPPNVTAHYDGKAADIPLVLDASYLKSRIVANLESKQVPPEAVAKQLPGLELRAPASLKAHAEGPVEAIDGTFALTENEGSVDGDFNVSVKEDLNAKANVRARRIDAADFTRAAPASNVNVTLQSAVLVPKTGPMTGTFDVASEPSVVAAQAVPAISVTGKFSNDGKTGQAKVDARAEIAEPGARTSIEATLTRAKNTNVEFDLSSKLDNPARLERLAHARLTGDLHARGNYSVEEQQLAADVRANLRGVSQGQNHVASVVLRANAAGRLPHPNSEVWLDLSDANLAGQHIENAKLALRGSLSRAAVSAEIDMLVPRRHVQVSTFISNDHGILVDHPALNLSQGDTDLKLSAKRVEIVNGRTTVDNLHLEGAGTVDGSFVYGTRLEQATLQTYQLDLARLWRLVDKEAPLKSGTATLGLDYAQKGALPRAELTMRAENVSFNRVQGGSVQANLAFAEGRLNGTAKVDLKRMGQLGIELRDLAGIDPARMDPAKLSGKLQADGQIDLRDISQLAPPGSDLPIARARGQVKYTLTVERDRPADELPLVHVHVSSKKLQLSGPRESKMNLTTKQEALDAAPPAIKGLDFDFDFKHDESGDTEFAGNIRDEYGQLGSASIQANIHPKLSTAARELAQNWRNIPLKVRTAMPPREIEQLPVEIRPAGLSGLASGEISYDGVITHPDLKITGRIAHFHQSERRRRSLDLAWEAAYTGERGWFKGTASAKQRQVGSADLDFETAIDDWLNHHGGPPPKVSGNAKITLDGFPIALFPGTQTSEVDGSLSGKIELKDFGKNATIDTQLEAKPFKVGQTEFARITTTVTAKDGKALAELRVEDHQSVTTAKATSGFDWGAKMAPSLVLPADAELHARGFHLAAAAPFVASTFGELDGRLDGDLNAQFRGGPPALDGHVDINEGVAQVASLGQRFDQIKGRVSLVPGKVKLESLSAHATSGKLNVTAEANLQGLDLTGAEAHVRIAKAEAISVSVAGTDIGGLWGAVDVNMQPGNPEHGAHLGVNVPSLHIYLPDTGGQDVQALDPAKNVRIGTDQHYGDFVTLPLQPLADSEPAKNEKPMVVDLVLGNDIWLERGDQVKAQVTGKTRMVLGDPTQMTGQIVLRGGKLDVQGKEFEVENGTITFSGEPSNPMIVATARWDAPDDERHRVYADYSGTVKNGKITLRSEPPLTQDEVLSLLLLGSADGTIGGPSNGGSSTAATAVGAVGGAATQGLNKALSNLSSLDVSTRIDSSTGSSRPELVVQISPKVSANITRSLGAPAPGQPPDMTFLTFEFRIRSRWSLSALVGDRGESGLDLIWRRRY